MDQVDVAHFQSFGFVVLRGALAAAALRAEVVDALGGCTQTPIDTGLTRFAYAPMMVPRTPASLAALDRFEATAAQLLGGAVLAVRAKGVRYFGATSWHADALGPPSSVGFLAYLDPLTADDGALRVLAGSHRPEYGGAVASRLRLDANGTAAEALPGVVLATAPGDVIAFHERLYHASAGGSERLQWRVDYVRAPASEDEARKVRAYYAGVFAPQWDGGYDPDLWPSYDPAWRASGRASVARLEQLGVYTLAAAQEAYMRARRRI